MSSDGIGVSGLGRLVRLAGIALGLIALLVLLPTAMTYIKQNTSFLCSQYKRTNLSPLINHRHSFGNLFKRMRNNITRAHLY